MADVHHPVWQPEGHLWKLGRHPCYDPRKVPWLGWAAAGAGLGGPAGQELGSRMAGLRELPHASRLAHSGALAGALSRHPRWHATARPFIRPTPQDLILPVMFSPKKYADAPVLGGAPRKREFLAVFKGGWSRVGGWVDG